MTAPDDGQASAGAEAAYKALSDAWLAHDGTPDSTKRVNLALGILGTTLGIHGSGAPQAPVGHVDMQSGPGDRIKWTGWALPHGTPVYAKPATALGESEPVAFRVSPRYEDPDQGYFDFTESKEAADKLEAKGWTITPLYERPESVPEYGSMDAGYTFAGVATTDGDKRLHALLVRTFGSDHRAVEDFEDLIFRPRPQAARATQEAPAPEVSSMQFDLIDAAKALQHAAQFVPPELAANYKERATKVFEIVSAIANGVGFMGEPRERAAFEEWAREEWKDRSIPDNAWLGWKGRAAYRLPASHGAAIVLHEAMQLADVYCHSYGLPYQSVELRARHGETRKALRTFLEWALGGGARTLSATDSQWWLEHRPQIIDALTEKGWRIMSDSTRVWLAPVPAGDAGAAQERQS